MVKRRRTSGRRHKKVGRPKFSVDNKKKQFLQIRVTEEEHNNLKEKAILANKSISDFVRETVVRSTPKTYEITVNGITVTMDRSEALEIITALMTQMLR